ncbi:pyridine nucleotide-disulfide oxidoreductase [Methanoculleus taiwanensis]|uniref:Pyridine nucleotide-disulfide oxidoreductase n=1 Tax=Methanoculleus taiwanensis TaxID=1550565 RepID=A0A498H4T5_9EURY|nr:NAD(P)/FAD-dependent oxidoreductase [Methanoculleus taiwanensis]RXE57155.1 pyridine nucleotide-disulfide oxidoreductase [Methanoculleus taiwanensis]
MIVVIGGGPAGRIAAMRLAEAGREVRLVEKRAIGGQCLHDRCMVVCALADAARLVERSRRMHDLGIFDAAPRVSFPAMMTRMREIQTKLGTVLDVETRKADVEILYGAEGRLEGRTAYIDDEPAPAEAVVAATGSRTALPSIPGTDLPGVYTYETFRELPDLPARIAVIGGGTVGAEFARIFRAFGSEVHLIARSSLLKEIDGRFRTAVLRDLAGVAIHENARVLSIEGGGRVRSVEMQTANGDTGLAVDAVFLATGLAPRSELLQGIRKDPLGNVIVDDHMRTSVPGVYAAGDVIGPPYLTPVARREGVVAADNILGRDVAMDYATVPQALELGYEFASVSAPGDDGLALSSPAPAGPGSFWDVASGWTGMAEIRVDPATGRIVGAAAAAPGASLLISYLGFLMRRGITVEEFDTFAEIHPSTDGIYWLNRYAAELLRKERKEDL